METLNTGGFGENEYDQGMLTVQGDVSSLPQESVTKMVDSSKYSRSIRFFRVKVGNNGDEPIVFRIKTIRKSPSRFVTNYIISESIMITPASEPEHRSSHYLEAHLLNKDITGLDLQKGEKAITFTCKTKDEDGKAFHGMDEESFIKWGLDYFGKVSHIIQIWDEGEEDYIKFIESYEGIKDPEVAEADKRIMAAQEAPFAKMLGKDVFRFGVLRVEINENEVVPDLTSKTGESLIQKYVRVIFNRDTDTESSIPKESTE